MMWICGESSDLVHPCGDVVSDLNTSNLSCSQDQWSVGLKIEMDLFFSFDALAKDPCFRLAVEMVDLRCCNNFAAHSVISVRKCGVYWERGSAG